MPCLDRNGEITGYIVETSTHGMSIDIQFIDDMATNVSELNFSTLYTVSVAAVNEAGTGPVGTANVTIAGSIII